MKIDSVLSRGSSGPNVFVFFARLEGSHIPNLVTFHAYIVREVWGQASRIHNGDASPFANGPACHGMYMGRSRTMAIFTTYRHFGEHVVLVVPFASRDWIRAATVTVEACCKNGPAKSDVRRFISWRHLPRFGAGVKDERRLKEITAPSDDAANSICSCADDPFELMLLAEHLCTASIQRIFTFVQFPIPGNDAIVPV